MHITYICYSICSLQVHMQNFAANIVNLVKGEGLYASQGGPIICPMLRKIFLSCMAQKPCCLTGLATNSVSSHLFLALSAIIY